MYQAVKIIGEVVEVKTDAKGFASHKIGRARVNPDLSKPLKLATITNFGGKKSWLGHYAKYRKEVVYDEEKFSSDDDLWTVAQD